MTLEMESMQRNVATLLKDSLEKALDPIEKRLKENGNIVRSLKEQLEDYAKQFDTVLNKIENVQANVSNNKNRVSSCRTEVVKLQKHLNQLEDRSRSKNVRLVNLLTGVEGDDPKGHLQKMLPKWISSLKGTHSAVVEADKAHRIFSNNTSRPRTMILRLCVFPIAKLYWRAPGKPIMAISFHDNQVFCRYDTKM